jgi:hypothetical protein
MGNSNGYKKRTYNNNIKKLEKKMVEMDDRKMNLEERFYSGDMDKKKYDILMGILSDTEKDIIKSIETNRFQLQSINKKDKYISWLDVHFDRIDIVREETDYKERRKLIQRYIHDITVLDYSKDTKQHTVVIKFKLPLYNDKFVWKKNKDGSHKTDKWGRWTYEILEGETELTNPFTHRKSFNRD